MTRVSVVMSTWGHEVFIARAIPQLRDERKLARLASNTWARREELTFDRHVDELVDFFRSVARRVRLRSA